MPSDGARLVSRSVQGTAEISYLYDALSRWRVFDLPINVNMLDVMYVIARRR